MNPMSAINGSEKKINSLNFQGINYPPSGTSPPLLPQRQVFMGQLTVQALLFFSVPLQSAQFFEALCGC